MYAFFYFWKMPFRWPNTCQDVMLAAEVAQRRPKCPADYEEIARLLSPIFSEDKDSLRRQKTRKTKNSTSSQGELVEQG